MTELELLPDEARQHFGSLLELVVDALVFLVIRGWGFLAVELAGQKPLSLVVLVEGYRVLVELG